MLTDRPLDGRVIAFRVFETNDALPKRRLFHKRRCISFVDVTVFCVIAYLIASTF